MTCTQCKYFAFDGTCEPCRSCTNGNGAIDYSNFEAITEQIQASDDVVNHPKHYNRDGALECIEEMRLIFGIVALRNYCLLNAWKYRYRASDKNGIEDLQKSDWYLKKYQELCE